jgi:hypothetical protein
VRHPLQHFQRAFQNLMRRLPAYIRDKPYPARIVLVLPAVQSAHAAPYKQIISFYKIPLPF